MKKTITVLILLLATLQLSAQNASLDLDFSVASDGEKFTPIFDTGGEFAKTVSNGEMKIVLNKKEWHFLQVWVNPLDFISNPFVSFRIKADQSTPVRIWLKQSGGGPELTVYNSVIEASSSYRTIAFTVDNVAPLTGMIQEVGVELGGYQVPPSTFAGTVYFDHFKLGLAAMPASSLDLDFNDPAHAAKLNYIVDTGGELTKTVSEGLLKLQLNKKEWHFFQVWVSPLNFIRFPYLRLKLRVDQPTPLRIWVTQQGGSPQKDLFNAVVPAGADFQTIQLEVSSLAPITGYLQELNLDFGGYQVPPATFSGTVYIDELKLGEAAKPAVEVFGTSYSEDFSATLFEGWSPGEGYVLNRQDDALRFSVSRTTPVTDGELNKLPSLSFGGKVLDVSANPYLNMDIKGDDPFVLSLIVEDNLKQRKERTVRVVPTGQFQTISINLGDIEGIQADEIERFYFDFNRSGFAFNSTILVDRITIGDAALNLSMMDAVADKKYYINSGEREILLTNIRNASAVAVSSEGAIVENVSVTPVTNGMAKLKFSLKADTSGTEEVSLTVQPEAGYSANVYHFDLTVEENLPPTISAVTHIKAEGKISQEVLLQGISDGNSTVEQPLQFSVTSSDTKVATAKVVYKDGPQGTLVVFPRKKGVATLTIAVKDGGGGNDSKTISLVVEVFNKLNNAPGLADVPDMEVYQDAGEVTVPLEGLTDGDKESQKIDISVQNDSLHVLSSVYISGEGTGSPVLHFTPVSNATGSTTLTLTLTDNGATGSNNGTDTTVVSFKVTVLKRPVTGYIASLRKDAEGFSGNDKYRITEVDSSGTRVLAFEATDKFYWDGVMMVLPEEIDLSASPYLTMEVFPLEQNTEHWIWFYDANGTRNDLNNRSGDHIQKAVAGKWNKLAFDFSGENDWINSGMNAEINKARITRILFDMHNAAFTWPPPPNYTGTFVVRNIRIGSAADIDLTTYAGIDPVSDQVSFTEKAGQTILLSGIAAGNGSPQTVSVTVENSNPALVTSVTVGDVNEQGEATLSYSTSAGSGTAGITIHVSAEGSEPAMVSFNISVLHQSEEQASSVTIDANQRHQRMYGFGTFATNRANNDFYAIEMGGSAMRVGLISNQFEPVNDNDDPNVLNMEGFDYSAFDWDALRDLKAKGVENFILTSWSPPAWMKTNLSLDYYRAAYTKDTDGTTNRLDYHMYEEFAESMVAIVRAFRQRAGIELLGIGLQNEPAFHEPYPSAILGPDRFVELIRVTGRRFKKEGIATKLYMAEQVSSFVNDNNQYLDAVQADPEVNEYTDVFAIHGYGSNGITPGQPNFSEWQNYRQNAAEGAFPKELWMTETHKDYNSWLDALQIAGAVYGALEHGNVSLWTQWSFEGPFVSKGKPTPMLYAMSNFSKFIKPGYVRMETTSAMDDILATSFLDETSGKVVVVMINKGNTALSAKVHGAPTGTIWSMYNTAENRNLEKVSSFQGDMFLLPARSITTITGDVPGDSVLASAMAAESATATDENGTEGTLSVYPNPNNGVFYFGSDSSVERVEIVDMNGQVRFSGNVDARASGVPVGGLRKGLYIVKMYSKKGSKQERIVIE